MARRRRKAAAKKSEQVEPEEEVSSTGEEVDSSIQEDSEEAAEIQAVKDGDKKAVNVAQEEQSTLEEQHDNGEKMETDDKAEPDTTTQEAEEGPVAADLPQEMEAVDSENNVNKETENQDATAQEAEQQPVGEMPAADDSSQVPTEQSSEAEQLQDAGAKDESGGAKPETESMQTDEDASKEGQPDDFAQEEYETVDATESADGMDNTDQQEEEKLPILTVEKEPSKPECHDDDSCKVPIDPEAEEDEEVIGSESPEFLKYWRAVLDNPQDFTNWTYLLQLVEQENKPPLARRAYNGFFKRYPLCYGYWKKFSEMEKRNGNLVRAQRILERGVRAIPLSIDLWVHMVDFYVNYYKGPDAGIEKVRKVLERATKASGNEFRSEKLWNKYVKWEQGNKDWKAVVAVYDKVLTIPTQHYAIFFKDFKSFVNSHSPKEILSVTEFETFLNEVRDEAEASRKEEKEKETTPNVDDDAPPGVESDDRGKPPNDKELKAINEKIIGKRKKIFEETEALVTKIWTFEEGIKRPYFHVKALERTQIKNWRDYLEAEIGRKEEKERVTLLFERCLIACALYEDFWLKYARYLMKVDPPAARNVFQRACEIHLPKKPNIHMHWATFEEMQGNTKAASKILEGLDGTLPNMAMIRLRRVAVERRAGRLEVAEDLLKSFVAGAAKGTEECFYVRKFVWFLVKVSKKIDVARQVLKDTVERNQDQIQLYKDLVGLEFSHGDEDQIIDACDLAINSTTLSEENKYKFSQRKLEYLEDYGLDSGRTQKAYDEHQRLFRSHKKRLQSQSEASAIQPITKKAKTDSSPGSKISSMSSSRYGSKTTTNGAYSYQNTQSSTITAAPIQTTNVAGQQTAYQQAAATGDGSLYYQNYWNYQQKPAEVQQQYNYSTGTWQQTYPQQQYYHQ